MAFLPQITNAIANLKNNNSTSQTKEVRELDKQIRREDEGIFVTAGRIIFGDKSFDKPKPVSNEKLIKTKPIDPNNDLAKFNPPGIIGFGVSSLNDGKGISVKSRRKVVLG